MFILFLSLIFALCTHIYYAQSRAKVVKILQTTIFIIYLFSVLGILGRYNLSVSPNFIIFVLIILCAAMLLTPNTLLQSGRYRIIDTLGRGGFGITYLAEQVMARRKVCIKEYFPEDYYRRDSATGALSLSSEGFAQAMNRYKAKFIKEAQTIAALDHPNIIHIHDIFEENNTAYYVMEYVEGESLSEVVKRGGVLSESQAVGYIRQVASALEYIHSRQIMHLDVKPGNIMVRPMDGSAILIDFGLSKHYDAVSGEATSTTPVGVSHGFAPIEQYKRGGVSRFSPETDIYSLGATLYYLVTGKIPPEAATLVTEPLNIPENISSKLCGAISRAMSVVPTQRPHGAKELVAMLESEVACEECEVVSYVADREKTVAVVVDNDRTVMNGVAAFNGEVPPHNEIWYTSSDRKIVIPKSAKAFGDSAFKDVGGKTKFLSKLFSSPSWSNTIQNGKGVIRLNGDVTEIGDSAFRGCENLTSIAIPESVTRIESLAFDECCNLKSITIPNGVETISGYSFYKCSNLTDIVIPESVFAIGEGAFCGCEKLTNIITPNGLPSVCRLMLAGCRSLTSVTISDKVSIIHSSAFSGCNSLTDVVIPNSVTTIGSYAFQECHSIRGITIPNSVKTIGESAFSDCSSMTDIVIPGSVATFDRFAFSGCSSLRDISLCEGLSTIGDFAFFKCSSLTSVTIPISVTSIGVCAFYLCENLKSVYCRAKLPPKLFIEGDDRLRLDRGATIFVPRDSIAIYQSQWGEYKEQIVGYDFD